MLRARLQREAAESRPQFSEALHRRILDAVEPRRAAAPARAVRRSIRRWVSATAAAACLLAAIVAGRQTFESENSPTPSATAMAEWSSWVDDAADDLDWQLVSNAVAVPSDQLKHDTRVAVETVLGRLPINVELFAE
ncbi:MAG: hypothetical protein ABFC77_01030 [Thermoguttaceae bacterium]